MSSNPPADHTKTTCAPLKAMHTRLCRKLVWYLSRVISRRAAHRLRTVRTCCTTGAQPLADEQHVMQARNDSERKGGPQKGDARDGNPSRLVHLQEQREKDRSHLGEGVGLAKDAGPEIPQAGDRVQHRARA